MKTSTIEVSELVSTLSSAGMSYPMLALELESQRGLHTGYQGRFGGAN